MSLWIRLCNHTYIHCTLSITCNKAGSSRPDLAITQQGASDNDRQDRKACPRSMPGERCVWDEHVKMISLNETDLQSTMEEAAQPLIHTIKVEK